MIKHYCDKCGKEIGVDNRNVLNISIRGPLSCPSKSLEFCLECIISAFGERFVEDIKADKEKKKRRISEKKAEIARKKQELSNEPPEEE
jgi:hypothetical protein